MRRVEAEVERRGFRVMRELCGHGIGRTIHEEPEVLFDGLHHGDEHMSLEMTLRILHWLADGYGGDARITDGGAPQLLQRLAATYLGEGVVFPPMPDPPPGHVLRITPTRYGGAGPWVRRG